MRPTHTSPAIRLCRAMVFAVLCVVLSATGHSLSSGHVVSWSALILATAVTTAGTWAVAGCQRGLCAITFGVLAAQGLLHLWFSIAPVSAGHHRAAEVTTAELVAEAQSLPMLCAHLVAGVVCGVWLWFGESTMFALVRTLYVRTMLPLLLLLVHPIVGSGPAALVPADPRVGAGPVTVLRYAMARRGPPNVFACEESVLSP